MDRNEAYAVMGCGCVVLLLFQFFMGFVVQQVWQLFRPEQPISYTAAMVLWFFIAVILSYFTASRRS